VYNQLVEKQEGPGGQGRSGRGRKGSKILPYSSTVLGNQSHQVLAEFYKLQNQSAFLCTM